MQRLWSRLDRNQPRRVLMLSFIGNLIGVKADNAVRAGVEALVRWDPQSASEAELRTMEQHLDDLGLQVASARQSYDREQSEAADPNPTASAYGGGGAAGKADRSGDRSHPQSGARKEPGNLGDDAGADDAAGRRRTEGRRRRQGFPGNAGEDLCRGGRQTETGPRRVGARPPRHGARGAATPGGRAAGRGGAPRGGADQRDQQHDGRAEGDA